MAYLHLSLNADSRPNSSRDVLHWIASAPAVGELVTGPRLEWFAYLLAQNADAVGTQDLPGLQDRLIGLYQRAHGHSPASLADLAHQYWPHNA